MLWKRKKAYSKPKIGKPQKAVEVIHNITMRGGRRTIIRKDDPYVRLIMILKKGFRSSGVSGLQRQGRRTIWEVLTSPLLEVPATKTETIKNMWENWQRGYTNVFYSDVPQSMRARIWRGKSTYSKLKATEGDRYFITMVTEPSVRRAEREGFVSKTKPRQITEVNIQLAPNLSEHQEKHRKEFYLRELGKLNKKIHPKGTRGFKITFD